MSQHAHVDESSKDRAYLSLFVILVALGIAMGIGVAAPHAPGYRAAGPLGVVVLEDGTVVRGTVLVRGAVLRVIREGNEQVLPRERVRWFDTESPRLGDRYFEQFPADAFAVRDPGLPQTAETADAAPVAEEGGIVVLDSGEVLEGWLRIDAQTVTVRWPYRARRVRGQVTIPRGDVRWIGLGADELTPEYWRKFGGAPIDPRYRREVPAAEDHGRAPNRLAPQHRSAPASELVLQAELAQTGGAFAEAALVWAKAYRAEGFKPAHFENLRRCCTQWVRGWRGVTDAQTSLVSLRDAFGPDHTRSELNQLYGEALMHAVDLATRLRARAAAHSFAEQLLNLGGAFESAGRAYLDRSSSSPGGGPAPPSEGPQAAEGHEGHDHGPGGH